MTREDILVMPAGRELDALVAERVMGFKVNKANAGIYDDGGLYIIEHHRYKPFRPSTDISAAWEVFEKFGYQGQVGFSGTEYFCEIMNGWNDDGDSVYGIAVECNSAPEAICKAALHAVTAS